ncbi:unnamed protein product [Dibothriocephalus latus]|uniref:Uncharacterized protein n=1 Tax=Dibothriocephalus latus TaxID=60516 RepID=A0A3P7N0P1_DIBLA|nr:unnamed protein product [Dibothriocephalus latus]
MASNNNNCEEASDELDRTLTNLSAAETSDAAGAVDAVNNSSSAASRSASFSFPRSSTDVKDAEKCRQTPPPSVVGDTRSQHGLNCILKPSPPTSPSISTNVSPALPMNEARIFASVDDHWPVDIADYLLCLLYPTAS